MSLHGSVLAALGGAHTQYEGGRAHAASKPDQRNQPWRAAERGHSHPAPTSVFLHQEKHRPCISFTVVFLAFRQSLMYDQRDFFL